MRILPRTRARIYPSGHDDEAEVLIEFSINNSDQRQQLMFHGLDHLRHDTDFYLKFEVWQVENIAVWAGTLWYFWRHNKLKTDGS